MKLIIPDHVIKIQAYEFRDKTELTEVVIPDSVETIGEGAFKGCRNLNRITVGSRVNQVGLFAFDGIGSHIDLVWLTPMSYRSPFHKILPVFEMIDSICAPGRDLDKANEAEKRALMCGYLLHPEWEQEYSLPLRQKYEAYFYQDFRDQFSELCDREILWKLFLACEQRNYLNEETAAHFISYIRTCRMTKEQKDFVDAMENRWGLVEGKEDDRRKKLRRSIRKWMSEQKMQEILEKEALTTMPKVMFCANEEDRPLSCDHTAANMQGKPDENESGGEAPAEALKYILASYLDQWRELEKRPSGFCREENADKVAGQLSRKSLLKALMLLTGLDTEGAKKKAEAESEKTGEEETKTEAEEKQTGEKSEKTERKAAGEAILAHPKIMIPLLRYADDETLTRLITKAEQWKQYDIYGEKGILARIVFEQGILLNDSGTALLHIYQQGNLEKYAQMRQSKAEEWMLAVAELLENRQLDAELGRWRRSFIQNLYRSYLSGTAMSWHEWSRYYMSHPWTRETASSLVWEKAGKQGRLFLCLPGQEPEDEYGDRIALEEDCQIRLAHPVFMSREQIFCFKQKLEKNGRKQCFEQLKVLPFKLDLGDWQLWNRRYDKMKIPYERLEELEQRGFQLAGSLEERIRISYYGKVLMEAFPTEEAGMLKLGYLLGSNYNMREINESCSILDEIFCYEMVLSGRTEAAPYLGRFDEEQMEALLEASIENGHQENVAVLLEQTAKRKMSDRQEDPLLDW